jgi:hypothetical protein
MRGVCLFVLPRLKRKIRVFLQWPLEIWLVCDAVQSLLVHCVGSGRLHELKDSALAAESAGAGEAANPTEAIGSDQTATVL